MEKFTDMFRLREVSVCVGGGVFEGETLRMRQGGIQKFIDIIQVEVRGGGETLRTRRVMKRDNGPLRK